MKDGKMVEQGTHEELLQKTDEAEDCVYGRLWREQSGAPGRHSEASSSRSTSSTKSQLGAIKTMLAQATKSRDIDTVKRGMQEVLRTMQLQADHLAESQAALEA